MACRKVSKWGLVVGDCVLEGIPSRFDGVEVGRVARQEQKLASDRFHQDVQPGAFVEGGVVQDEDLSWSQGRAQLLLEPRLGNHASVTTPR